MKRYSDNIISPSFFTSQNVSNLMDDTRAEALLKSAVYYIDARDPSSSGQIIDNLGTAKELLPTTLGSSTSIDSNDPKYLDWYGTNYVYLPGVSGNYLSVPDANNLDIVGNIDIRAKISMDSWTPSSNATIIGKFVYSNYSYALYVGFGGKIGFTYSSDGTTNLEVESTSTLGLSNGSTKWIRTTFQPNNGSSGKTATFYTSDDGITWTQLGSSVVTAGTTSLYSGTAQIELGSFSNGAYNNTGQIKIYRAQIFDGIDGIKVLDVDTSVLKTGAETSFTALTGQTVTINRSTSGRKAVAVTQPCWLFGTDDYMEVNNRYVSTSTPCLYVPGIAGNNASAPDSAALDITGDIDIRVKVAMDDWTPSAVMGLIGKAATAADAYYIRLATDGKLDFIWTDSSNVSFVKTSTVTTGITDGDVKWIRATLDVDNGASGNDVKFYTSDDGINWTQLGTTVTTAGVTNIRNTNAQLNVGAYRIDTAPASGKFFRAQVFNGIDGTKVFDADFENKITSFEQTTFTEASSNAATVTINRSGSTYRSAGITKSGYLYPGSTNTFTASTTDFLNPNQSNFTALLVYRAFATPATYLPWLHKYGAYRMEVNNPQNQTYSYFTMNDGSSVVVYPGQYTYGNITMTTMMLNRSGSNVNNTMYLNSSLSGTPANTTSVANVSTPNTLRIAESQDGEVYAAAIFRRVLTSNEIALITNYFNRRSL